jgi:hypothetical protein
MVLALSNNGKKLRMFGVRLAKSYPKELFKDFMWDGHRLLEQIDTCAWSGAYI